MMGAPLQRRDAVCLAQILPTFLVFCRDWLLFLQELARRDTMCGAKHMVEVFSARWKVATRWCFARFALVRPKLIWRRAD